MRKRITIEVGDRYSNLVVTELTTSGRHKLAVCHCDCGNTTTTNIYKLSSGHTKSCGCRRGANRSSTAVRNPPGSSKKDGYLAWQGMITRCTNKNHKWYHRYGGRGVTIDQSWIDSFHKFMSDMGPRPTKKHSIERKDNNKGYEPGNCVWATKTTQNCNRGNYNRVYEMDGQRMCLAEWIRATGVNGGKLRARIRIGWDFVRAIKTP